MRDAYYSPQAAKMFGVCHYLADDGSLLLVTEVVNEDHPPVGHWKDAKKVGRVVKFLKRDDSQAECPLNIWFKPVLEDFVSIVKDIPIC